MKKIIIISSICAVLALSGCSQPAVTVTDTAPSATPTQADVSWDNITAFVDEQWNGEPKKALALTAPDSPARKYATFQTAADEAYRTNGQDQGDAPTYSFVDDPSSGTITITEELPSDATVEPQEYVWSDFEVDSQGLVVAWTGASGPLRDALWTKDVTATAGSTKVELVGAYKANRGALYVVLDVVAGPRGAQLDSAPAYVEDGRSMQPSYWVTPYEVEPNTRAYHVYVYEGADFGGMLKSDVMTQDYDRSGSVSIKIV